MSWSSPDDVWSETYSRDQGRSLPMGQPGQSEQLAPPPQYIKIWKKSEALQYCDSNEFIELTVGTSRV
jgi:hypothetical protein